MRYRNQLVFTALVLGLVFLMPWKAIGDGATSLAKTIAATQSGTWTVQPGNTANTTAWLFNLVQGGNTATVLSTGALKFTMYDAAGNEIVVPTAGLTSYLAATASTNATNVKSSAGTVYAYNLMNTTATLYYLRMYNLASAPTCSSATGYVQTIPIPASASGAGVQIPKNIGQAFTTGVSYCVTGGSGSTDNTNAAAGVYVDILYK